MAKLKLSSLVSSIDGKLGGSSFHSNKGGSFLRNKSYPKKSNTRKRINSVQQFSSLVSAWSLLTTAQKANWNNFTRLHAEKTKDGEKYNPGGYAHFLAYNRLRDSADLQPLLDPGNYTGKPYTINFSVSEFYLRINENENIIQSLILDIELSGDISQDSTYVVSISQPLGKTSTQNYGTMYPIGYFRIPAGYTETTTFSVLLPEINPNPLILLQPDRPYAVEITPISQISAIYTIAVKTIATSQIPEMAPEMITNPTIVPGFASGTEILNGELDFFGFRFSRSNPINNLSGYRFQSFTGIMLNALPTIYEPQKFYFGSFTYLISSANGLTPGISDTNGYIYGENLRNLPVNYLQYGTNGIHSKTLRLQDINTGLFTRFFFLATDTYYT